MRDSAYSNGIWHGIYWRFIGGSVLALILLQWLGFRYLHYPVLQSVPVVLMVISYLVIPRAKERRLLNALLGVAAMFVLDLALEVFAEHDLTAALRVGQLGQFIQLNAFGLLLGIAVAYGYLRLSQWSEQKRMAREAKRKADREGQAPTVQRRVHHKNKKRGRR